MRTLMEQWLLFVAVVTRLVPNQGRPVKSEGDRNLIVGGEDATLGRYPYAVTLQRGFGSHVCMGSLIAPDIVLTAAHCGDMQEAHIGRDQVQSDNDISETFAIVDRRYHPRYEFEPDVFDFDYSIVKLIGESSITPIMLNRNPMFPGVGFEVTTVGWGLTNVSDTTSLANDLQEATVKAIDNEQCRGLWSAETVQDHMYCTANDGMGVSCRGDSGAPSILRGSSATSDVQMGIVSWGPTVCDDLRLPGVNMRITSEYNWIESVVCELSSNPPEDFNCDAGFTISPAPTISPTGPTASPGPTTNQVSVRVSITLDNFPQEFGWKIEDETGTKLAGENPGFYTEQGAVIEQTVLLDYGKTHSFTAIDIAGDGICCQDGSGNYQLELQENSRMLVSGTGIFEGVQRHKFVVLDAHPSTLFPTILPFETSGNFPISISIRLDENAEKFGWSLDRLDMDERTLVVNVPPGSYTSPGQTVFDTVFVEEGGLYQIALFDDGFDGVGDEILIRLGGSSNGRVIRIPGAFTERQQRTFIATASGDLSIPTYEESTLSLFFRFDNFPQEIGWFLMAGRPAFATNNTDELEGPVSTDSLSNSEDALTVVAFGPTSSYDSAIANRELTRAINLPALSEIDREFVLVVHDSFGDGLCCGFGSGFFDLFYGPPDNEIRLYSGTIQETERTIFKFTLTESGPPTLTTDPTPVPGSVSGSFYRTTTLASIGGAILCLCLCV